MCCLCMCKLSYILLWHSKIFVFSLMLVVSRNWRIYFKWLLNWIYIYSIFGTNFCVYKMYNVRARSRTVFCATLVFRWCRLFGFRLYSLILFQRMYISTSSPRANHRASIPVTNQSENANTILAMQINRRHYRKKLSDVLKKTSERMMKLRLAEKKFIPLKLSLFEHLYIF